MPTNKRFACFTDIHWGAKNNLTLHNQDNLDFIDWFIIQYKKADCNAIAFLGDWFENRNAINIETSDYSYRALKKLNDLNVPIYFIVGNHDLYRRNTRDVHSVNIFNEFTNFVVIDKPTIIDDTFLFCPFMFEREYPNLAEYSHLKVWFGHFEFKDFILTGAAMKAEHGLNHKSFSNQTHIFSGHYHKRQAIDNVCYIGNPFPTNFGDASDITRGMMIYDHKTDDVDFKDYIGPTYIRTTLSRVLDEDWDLPPSDLMRVICTNDVELSYSEAQVIKETLKEQFEFREFRLEENYSEKKDALENTMSEAEINISLSIDEIVINSLIGLDEIKTIDNKKLIELYKQL